MNERPVFDAVYHGVKSAVTASRDMKSVDLAQHAKRPVDPYKPDVVVKPQQMVLNQPPKTETVKPMPGAGREACARYQHEQKRGGSAV